MVTESIHIHQSDHTHKHTSESAAQLDTKATIDACGSTPEYSKNRLYRALRYPNLQVIYKNIERLGIL